MFVVGVLTVDDGREEQSGASDANIVVSAGEKVKHHGVEALQFPNSWEMPIKAESNPVR